jgi:hypothetical protein
MRGWLLTIAKSAAYDIARRPSSRPFLPVDDADVWGWAGPDSPARSVPAGLVWCVKATVPALDTEYRKSSGTPRDSPCAGSAPQWAVRANGAYRHSCRQSGCPMRTTMPAMEPVPFGVWIVISMMGKSCGSTALVME